MKLHAWITVLVLLALPAQAQQAAPPAPAASAAPPAPAAPPLTAEQAALKAHVQFLASDALRGREAGTHDYDVAAEYVAAQMLAIGLKPGGERGGWFQPFRLATYRAAEKAHWTLRRGSRDVPLQFGTDFINNGGDDSGAFRAEGDIVFAGYGIVDPQSRYDDYAGLDVRGKIVLIVSGKPKGLSRDVAAHFDDDRNKAQSALVRGAAAIVFVETPALRKVIPFEKMVGFYDYPITGWAAPEGATLPSDATKMIGAFSMTGAEKLFAGARIRWADVIAAESRGTRMPTGPLVGRLAVATVTTRSTKDTRNVVGMIEGSDPALRNQYVVLSAHLDHLGVGKPVNGDAIYNGAMDNAIGIAEMLEVVRAIQQSGKRPRRSILVLATAAEEKGMFGSAYFARYPTVPKDAIVADLNLDMPILTYPLVDLVVQGGDHSSIGQLVAAAARTEGLGVVPDPEPREMSFVRSDHYSFVKAGIPAVSIDTGPGGIGAAASRKFLDENYHQPSDQIDLPFDWNSAVKYKHVGLATALALADADARPVWNKGDFFGTLYGGVGAQ
ncbi:M20/M25/M40 family metallo-hydrolase [Sphingomonas azotifigens]|uniref:M20/M25/M40 family metallo-hydrolase n=1 Tax=Sphingomonas azotifigens TaxID=330920 RepID=UPI000A0750E8|nr:M20/M25/M40 family metallo-hydrolase [Sphingomonas azotifigens]